MLKKKMKDADLSTNKKRMKEFLIRLIYVEMLGHDASFGYIKAVELSAAKNLIQKRTGYLCASLVLAPSHEFRFMLVNVMQTDMASSNYLEAWGALSAICKLVTRDMIPALIAEVVKLLGHQMELVRKKAVMALHRFHRSTRVGLAPQRQGAARAVRQGPVGDERVALHADRPDQDRPDALQGPRAVVRLDPQADHRAPAAARLRLPPHARAVAPDPPAAAARAARPRGPGRVRGHVRGARRRDAPRGHGDQRGLRHRVRGRAPITIIYPNAKLLDQAASSIARFISSDNHNLKYLGITGLAEIVKGHPKYAAEHQLAVIDCLEDPDDTLRRKTLDLLYRMINTVNIEFICTKLLAVLESASSDVYLRTDLVTRITSAAERFAPSNSWYARRTTTRSSARVAWNTASLRARVSLPLSLRFCWTRRRPRRRPSSSSRASRAAEVAHNLMTLIAEGSGEDDEADEQMRRDAVDEFVAMLDDEMMPDAQSLPENLLQIMAWTLGEYGYLCSELGGDDGAAPDVGPVVERLVGIAHAAVSAAARLPSLGAHEAHRADAGVRARGPSAARAVHAVAGPRPAAARARVRGAPRTSARWSR